MGGERYPRRDRHHLRLVDAPAPIVEPSPVSPATSEKVIKVRKFLAGFRPGSGGPNTPLQRPLARVTQIDVAPRPREEVDAGPIRYTHGSIDGLYLPPIDQPPDSPQGPPAA